MKFVDRPSPNHNERRTGAAIDILLLHYTGMQNAEEALRRLTDPAAKVSAHYTVDEDGTVYRHVPESLRAWHAGVSFWAGERDINSRAIGIELVNPGHEFGYRAFPHSQIAALIDLAHAIMGRHPIPAHRILGHGDVAFLRRSDPGELFPWRILAQQGIGLWPRAVPVPDTPTALRDLAPLRRHLAAFGYECAQEGPMDGTFAALLRAFQRHFRPAKVDGAADAETRALAAGLAHAMARQGAA